MQKLRQSVRAWFGFGGSISGRGPARGRRPAVEVLEDRLNPAPLMLNVNTFADVVNPTDGMLSLREAVTMANAHPGSTINLQAGTYSLSLTGGSDDANLRGDLDVKSSVTINGVAGKRTIERRTACLLRPIREDDAADEVARRCTVNRRPGELLCPLELPRSRQAHRHVERHDGDAG